MSPFEIGMLICFGASWPLSVYKTYKSKSTQGKSFRFLLLVFVGYLSGIFHKVYFNYDLVIFLYMFNALLVIADIILHVRYRWLKPAPNP